MQSSVSAHNIRGWGEGKECGLACEACPGTPSRSQGSLDLESSTREEGKQRRPPLERMCSVDRMTGLERGERGRVTGERKREREALAEGKGWGSANNGGVDVFDVPWSVFFPLSCVSLLSPVCLFCALSLCGVDHVCMLLLVDLHTVAPESIWTLKLHLMECFRFKSKAQSTAFGHNIDYH